MALIFVVDKCNSCIFHICAVLSKGEAIQTACYVFHFKFLVDQRSSGEQLQRTCDQILPTMILSYNFTGKSSRLDTCKGESKIH